MVLALRCVVAMGFLLSLVLCTIGRLLRLLPLSCSAVSVYPHFWCCPVRVQVLFPALFPAMVACLQGITDLPSNLGLDLVLVGHCTVPSLLLILFEAYLGLRGWFHSLTRCLVVDLGPHPALSLDWDSDLWTMEHLLFLNFHLFEGLTPLL